MRAFAYGFLIVLAGCFGPASQVNNTDSIVATGTALEGDGTPAAGVEVQLIRHPDALQVLGDLFVTVATLGLACLAQSVDLCRPFEKSTTDASGGFLFAVRGADTQGTGNQALLFTAFHRGAATPAGATGRAGVAVDFYMQRTRFDIPDLRLWESVGSEMVGGNSITFQWASLSSAIGKTAADYKLVISVASDVLWTQSATTTSTSIDPRVTQDFAGSWSIWAKREEPGEGTDFDFTYYSPAVAYATKGLVPKSRGKDCYVQGESGPVKQSPCALTDGKLSTRYQAVAATPCPQGQMCTPPPLNGWVYFDLGQNESLSALVLYDTSTSGGMIAVEGSSDAMNWSTLTTTSGTYKVVTLSGSARYVRLKLEDKKTFSSGGNREIAIY